MVKKGQRKWIKIGTGEKDRDRHEWQGRSHPLGRLGPASAAGGGVQGDAVYGKTSGDGSEVIDRRAQIGDVLATLCAALGVDPNIENISEVGRPIRIAEGTPIREILA